MMNLSGQRFGRLVVLDEAPRKEYGARMWYCKCDCGKEKIVFQQCLMNGHSRSCGCIRKEQIIERSTTHGLSHKRIYNIYHGMINRCFNNNEHSYPDYGGRGITVCDEWSGDSGFENFYEWAVNNGYSEKLTIDRIDVNGNYEPSNCKWSTYEEQSKNKRNNYLITWRGKTQILKDWCKELNLSYGTLTWRMRKGWSTEKMLTTPTEKGFR